MTAPCCRAGDEAARGQSEYARKGRGAGVGLAISQQLIELMGGEIKCESEYGARRGSTYYGCTHVALYVVSSTHSSSNYSLWQVIHSL